MPKVEHTLQLTPTYLAGLQEARGDVDRVARNVDITIRQQGDEMRNKMQHLNGQFVHMVVQVREEMLIQHQEMEKRMKYELKDQENGITELQEAYHAIRSEYLQNFEDIVKYQKPAPPQPVNPVHGSSGHSRKAQDGRIGGAINGTVPSRGDTLSLDGSKNLVGSKSHHRHSPTPDPQAFIPVEQIRTSGKSSSRRIPDPPPPSSHDHHSQQAPAQKKTIWPPTKVRVQAQFRAQESQPSVVQIPEWSLCEFSYPPVQTQSETNISGTLPPPRRSLEVQHLHYPRAGIEVPHPGKTIGAPTGIRVQIRPDQAYPYHEAVAHNPHGDPEGHVLTT